MSERMYSGSCACGRVVFEFAGPVESTYHCHCSRCRRLHSAGFVTWTVLPHRQFRLLSSLDTVSFYASSEREHRAFCRNCGSYIFAEAIDPVGREDVYVSVAAVREPHDLEPQFQIYADSRARWVALDSRLPAYDGSGPKGPLNASQP